MQKINYDKVLEDIVKGLNKRAKLILHSCCAPCSSAVITRLKEHFDISVIYYNPNIYPKEEYNKRKEEQIRLLDILGVNFIDCDYNEEEFLNEVKGLENEEEGGARCTKCFYLRLSKTAKVGEQKGFDFFGTTLTISPHKKEQIINTLGINLEKVYNIKYLPADFKKQNGYLNSIKLSQEYNLYRQNYCGCRYSLKG